MKQRRYYFSLYFFVFLFFLLYTDLEENKVLFYPVSELMSMHLCSSNNNNESIRGFTLVYNVHYILVSLSSVCM